MLLSGTTPVLADSQLVASVSEITAAMQTVQPGDTLIMATGVWQNADITFKGNGTATQPITLQAQVPGQVTLSGTSRLRLAGSFLVVSGLQFTNGYVTSDAVVEFRDADDAPANHCRLTECAIIDYNPPSGLIDTKWVSLYGVSNRVDNCYFAGKTNAGTTLVVWVSSQPDQPNGHRLDHNYFGPRSDLGVNGGETIRVGTSEVSMNRSGTLVERNYFERCNGEIEIISNKSCENVYRHNTFVECEGTLTLRHGNRCVVAANYFFGHLKPLTGGVRVIGEDHQVFNNYFGELTGTSGRSALTIMQGLENSPLNGYFQVKRAVVAFNTFVNCQNSLVIGLPGTYSGTPQVTTLPPEDCVIANNIVLTSSGKLVDQRITPVNLTWEGNIMYGTSLGIATNSGIWQTDPQLLPAADGLWRPATNSPVLGAAQGNYDFVTEDIDGTTRPVTKDVGCDQASSAIAVYPPLTPADVGPLWMRPSDTVSYEADVQPRPHGSTNGTVTITDWVQAGRFAAALDQPVEGGEFQRADCAPSATLGNGALSIADWVQAGRYASGLDPVKPVGGPTAPIASAINPGKSVSALASRGDGTGRFLRVRDTMMAAGTTKSVAVVLKASGNENAAGFTLSFDPAMVRFVGAKPTAASAAAALLVNTNALSAGKVGVALALPPGSTFAPGTQEIISLALLALPHVADTNTGLEFIDGPIAREMADVQAQILAASYGPGILTVMAASPLSFSLRIPSNCSHTTQASVRAGSEHSHPFP